MDRRSGRSGRNATWLSTTDALRSRCWKTSILHTRLKFLGKVVVRLLFLGRPPTHLVLHTLSLTVTDGRALNTDAIGFETPTAIRPRENEKYDQEANIVVVKEMGTKVAYVARKTTHLFKLRGVCAVDEALSHGVWPDHVPANVGLENIGDR